MDYTRYVADTDELGWHFVGYLPAKLPADGSKNAPLIRVFPWPYRPVVFCRALTGTSMESEAMARAEITTVLGENTSELVKIFAVPELAVSPEQTGTDSEPYTCLSPMIVYHELAAVRLSAVTPHEAFSGIVIGNVYGGVLCKAIPWTLYGRVFITTPWDESVVQESCIQDTKMDRLMRMFVRFWNTLEWMAAVALWRLLPLLVGASVDQQQLPRTGDDAAFLNGEHVAQFYRSGVFQRIRVDTKSKDPNIGQKPVWSSVCARWKHGFLARFPRLDSSLSILLGFGVFSANCDDWIVQANTQEAFMFPGLASLYYRSDVKIDLRDLPSQYTSCPDFLVLVQEHFGIFARAFSCPTDELIESSVAVWRYVQSVSLPLNLRMGGEPDAESLHPFLRYKCFEEPIAEDDAVPVTQGGLPYIVWQWKAGFSSPRTPSVFFGAPCSAVDDVYEYMYRVAQAVPLCVGPALREMAHTEDDNAVTSTQLRSLAHEKTGAWLSVTEFESLLKLFTDMKKASPCVRFTWTADMCAHSHSGATAWLPVPYSDSSTKTATKPCQCGCTDITIKFADAFLERVKRAKPGDLMCVSFDLERVVYTDITQLLRGILNAAPAFSSPASPIHIRLVLRPVWRACIVTRVVLEFLDHEKTALRVVVPRQRSASGAPMVRRIVAPPSASTIPSITGSGIPTTQRPASQWSFTEWWSDFESRFLWVTASSGGSNTKQQHSFRFLWQSVFATLPVKICIHHRNASDPVSPADNLYVINRPWISADVLGTPTPHIMAPVQREQRDAGATAAATQKRHRIYFVMEKRPRDTPDPVLIIACLAEIARRHPATPLAQCSVHVLPPSSMNGTLAFDSSYIEHSAQSLLTAAIAARYS